ncbi:MAG: hypothetical protein QF565_06300, partial [Arenicellales bacterium]|nr:hypothetical protein [Arenicellales bacterium]
VQMPKALETKPKRSARRRGMNQKQSDRYVYGTLRKTGWTPKKRKASSRCKFCTTIQKPIEELRTELADLIGKTQKPEVEYFPKNLN